MKVYTKVKTHYNHSDVGIVLLSDKNDIYLQEGFKIQNTDNIEAHTYGIKRALSFVKNMKPLYAKNDLEVLIPEDVNEKLFQSRLKTDSYISYIQENLNIKIIPQQTILENDEYFKMIAGHQLLNMNILLLSTKER